MKTKETMGITIISLVITIIILLILSGVTISIIVGENGILTKARLAKQMSEVSSEKEAIQLDVTLANMENILDTSNKYYLGIPLYDKTLENGNEWNIIVENESQTIYGTGWNYIEKETEIANYGKTQYGWLVNYESGELKEFEENKYTQLKYGNKLAVIDGLIFNLDSSIIENSNKENIQQTLGSNVELVNFDWNENSGLTSKEFNFDGVNDYIKIKYDDKDQKEQLAKGGFTFEFYGILDDGITYNADNEIVPKNVEPFQGVFCYWNGDESKQARFRVGTGYSNNSFRWNAGFGNYFSDYIDEKGGMGWNVMYKDVYEKGKRAYYAVTLDCSNDYSKTENEYYKASFYKNGEKQYEGRYNKKSWNDFVSNELNGLKFFCIGRSSMQGDGWWCYSKMKANAIRLYSRGLSEQEIKKNYDSTILYYSTLVENEKSR